MTGAGVIFLLPSLKPSIFWPQIIFLKHLTWGETFRHTLIIIIKRTETRVLLVEGDFGRGIGVRGGGSTDENLKCFQVDLDFWKDLKKQNKKITGYWFCEEVVFSQLNDLKQNRLKCLQEVSSPQSQQLMSFYSQQCFCIEILIFFSYNINICPFWINALKYAWLWGM